LNTQDRRDIFERWRATPFLRDKMRSLKPSERKPVPNMTSFMHELGYSSFKSFLHQYNHYLRTGDASESACSGGNTPLLSPELLKKAVKEAASATTTVGGMSYTTFLSFIDPYVRKTRIQYRKAGANDNQFPLSEFATDKTLKWHYRRVLPWAVRRGDRAIQARLNVRNDLLAWISHHCMIAAVVAGCDGKTWPHSVDKLVPRSYSCMNVDAFSVKVEGGEFDKCAGRTSYDAVLDARQSGHGLKIMDNNSRVHVGPIDEDDNDEQHKRWVQSLEIDSDGEDNSNSTTRIEIQLSESMEEVQVVDASDSDDGDDDEDDVDDEDDMEVEVGAHG